MEELKLLLKNLANLVKLKTIVTLILIGVISWGFTKEMVAVEVYVPLVMAVITYYFTKKED